MSIKILHILHSLQVGGLENGVVNLINGMDPDRFRHEICCITASGPMAQRIVPPVPVHELGKGAGSDHLLPFKIARLVRRIKPDIVHTRNWGTIDGVIGARLAGVGCLVHGEHGREAADPNGANARRNLARRLLAPLVSGFVTVSLDLRSWMVREVGVPEAKVAHIMNGVDTRKFSPPADRTAAKLKVGLDPQALSFGTVGRLDPVKDQETLLWGFARALERFERPAELVLVGSGPEEQKLRRVAGELGVADRVKFLGERRDIADLLAALDLFVLPSIGEGISNTILEAMACGLPVLASRVGGNVELVQHGVTGFLFEAGDWRGLAGLLGTDLALLERCGAQGRRAAEARFSLGSMVAGYSQMYLKLHGSHNS